MTDRHEGAADAAQMASLAEWLEDQKGGVATFYEFARRALALRSAHPDNAALLRLLADLAGRFADEFDGEPLEVETANGALRELTRLTRRGAILDPRKLPDRLALLNEIGTAELAPRQLKN